MNERTVTIAPHLWAAIEVMAADMNVDPAALCNQAVFSWLRINGYVVPGTVAQAHRTDVGPGASIPDDRPTSPQAEKTPASFAPAPAPGPQPKAAQAKAEPPPAKAEPQPAPEPAVETPAKVAKRLAELDAAVEKLSQPRQAWARGPEAAPAASAGSSSHKLLRPVEAQPAAALEPETDALAHTVAREGLRPEDYSGEMTAPPSQAQARAAGAPAPDEEERPAEPTIFVRAAPLTLFIERENQPPLRVAKERFIIGRGPGCDLVIDSPRVSREHVAITRKGTLYVLQDLGSSNGTWFNAERIGARELENGDVLLLGNEQVTFVMRADE